MITAGTLVINLADDNFDVKSLARYPSFSRVRRLSLDRFLARCLAETRRA